MNPKHILTLILKEFRSSSANFFIAYTILVPLLLSFFVSVLFGSLFSSQPDLGVVGDGDFAAELLGLDAVRVREYGNEDDLLDAVESGAVDIGVVVPENFDRQLQNSETVTLSTYVWGESQANDRATVYAAINSSIFKLSGAGTTLTIDVTRVGDADSLDWDERLLPLIMIIVVIIGGMIVPASSLIDEREKHTIRAILTTPIRLQEVFFAKATIGVVLSVTIGVVVLVMNQAFGTEPVMLVLILLLSAIMAAEFGLLLGTFIADMNSFFATIKAIGLLLYAPALIMMFPEVPQWIAQVFPTYYIIGPVTNITLDGASATDVLPEVAVLFVMTLIGMGLLGYFGQSDRKYAL